MSRDNAIECDLHDYIEIVCMFRYKIKVHLKSQYKIVGTAITTDLDSMKNERLILVKVDNTKVQIRLDHIAVIKVLTKNACFEQVNF